MKIVLFDLGRTLEDNDVLLPGAVETLQAIQAMRDPAGQPPILGLVSNFELTDDPAKVPVIQQQCYQILERLGIRSFFEPVQKRVTLSTEVGVFKPDEKIFRAALDKVGAAIAFGDALFVTEELAHVLAARTLGMKAVHFKGPGQTTGDVTQLVDLVPMIQIFLGSAE